MNSGFYNPIFLFLLGIAYFILLPSLFLGLSLEVVGLFLVMVISFVVGYMSASLSFRASNLDGVAYTVRPAVKKISNIVSFLFVLTVLYRVIDFGYGGEYKDKYIVESQLSLYFTAVEKLWLIICVFFLSVFASRSKFNFVVAALSSVIYVFMDSTRILLLLALFYWAILGSLIGYFKVRIIYLVVFLVLSPFLFVLLLIKRLVNFDGGFISLLGNLYEHLNLEDLWAGMYVGLETFYSYETLALVVEDRFIEPFSGYLRIFFMLVPRSFWADKPESISRLIAANYYPEAYYKGGGQLAGPIGDSYINGGVLGVLLIWLLIGYFSCYLFRVFRVRVGGARDPSVTAFFSLNYFVFLSYFVYCLRGFGSDFFWVFLLQLLVMYFLRRLVLKRYVE